MPLTRKSAGKTASRSKATPARSPSSKPRLNGAMACDTAFRIVARRHLDALNAHHAATCKGDPEGVLLRMLRKLDRYGLEATAANHEFCSGQFEINLWHSEALDAADRAFRFKSAVKEEMEISVRVEPGVLAIYAVAEKENPAKLRFFEMYADEAAFRSHIDSPHFKKFRATTQDMVVSRKLIETVPVQLSEKKK